MRTSLRPFANYMNSDTAWETLELANMEHDRTDEVNIGWDERFEEINTGLQLVFPVGIVSCAAKYIFYN